MSETNTLSYSQIGKAFVAAPAAILIGAVLVAVGAGALETSLFLGGLVAGIGAGVIIRGGLSIARGVNTVMKVV